MKLSRIHINPLFNLKPEWSTAWIFGLLFIASLMVFGPMAQAASILVIDSYESTYGWTASLRKGFEESLNADHHVEYVELDTKRIPLSQFESRANAAWERFVEKKPEMVVFMDDNALKFLGEKVARTGVPVIFVGINNNPRLYFNGTIPPNVSGVLEKADVKHLVQYLRRIVQPAPRNLIMLMDAGKTSHSLINGIQQAKPVVLRDGASMEIFLLDHIEDWQEKIRSAKTAGYDGIVIGSYAALKDKSGTAVPVPEVTSWTQLHAPVPLFSLLTSAVGKGKTVGGLYPNPEQKGHLAGELANDVLANPHNRTPAIKSPKDFDVVFSKAELEKWGMEINPDLKDRVKIIE